MALFQMKWLRRFVRRNTKPMPLESAEIWKRRLSVGYMLLAWNAFGLVCYMVYTGKNDWAKFHGIKSEEDERLTPAQQYAKMMKIDKAKVLRFSGLNKVNEFEIEKATEPSSAKTS